MSGLSRYRYSLGSYGSSVLIPLIPWPVFAPYILRTQSQTCRSGHPSSYPHNSKLLCPAPDRPCILGREYFLQVYVLKRTLQKILVIIVLGGKVSDVVTCGFHQLNAFHMTNSYFSPHCMHSTTITVYPYC